MCTNYTKKIEGDTDNNYKRWVAPDYEFMDSLDANCLSYKDNVTDRLKECPFGITCLNPDDKFYFSVKQPNKEVSDGKDYMYNYLYGGCKLFILGFPTYYPRQKPINGSTIEEDHMYWPWYDNKRILEQNELSNIMYPVRYSNIYELNNQKYRENDRNKELLRLNLKSIAEDSDKKIPEKIELIMNKIDLTQFELDQNPIHPKQEFINNINKAFKEDGYSDNDVEKYNIPYWKYKEVDDGKVIQTEKLNHWKVAMDSLKNITELFKNNDKILAINRVTGDDVLDPLKFLFMNKKVTNEKLQFKILIPGLNLDYLDINARNHLTQYLINAEKPGLSPKKLTESKKYDLINWLVENKAFDDEIMKEIIDQLIKPKLENLKATYMSVSKTAKLKEQMDKYITLSMESWYINQNISGILKKCSEQSGINPHEIERTSNAIIPWRNPYYTSTKDGTEILETFYKQDDIETKLEKLPKPPDKPQLNTILDGSMANTIDVIQDWIRNRDYHVKTKNFIKHCQLNYQEAKLFPITTFPESIQTKNEEVYDKRSKLIQEQTNADKRLQEISNWSKEKIDTVVGALMDPYFKVVTEQKSEYNDLISDIRSKIKLNTISTQLTNLDRLIEKSIKKAYTISDSASQPPTESDTVMPIVDFKMFYVLQNNNTQLKCYDQLKVLANFASFIKKVGSK